MKLFKKKFDFKNLLLLLFSIGFTLIILEIGLRILLASNQDFLKKSFQDKPFLVKNKYWKRWHYPNSTSRHLMDCFDVQYQTNSLGMNQTEISAEKDTSVYRIALVGDSFVEGYSNYYNKSFPYLLDSMTGKKVEVLNFGLSGGVGTVNELALYENFVTHFKPDLVLLYYLNYNDVHDNINSMNDGMITKDLKFKYPVATKEEIFKEVTSQVQPPPSKIYIEGFYVLSLANKGFRSLGLFMQTALNMKFNFRTYLARTYSPEHSEEIQIGYDIAEKSLERLKQLTARDSADFVLINLPDPFQIDPNWVKAVGIKNDFSIDPLHPNKIVKGICEKLDITYHSMYDNAVKEIADKEMNFPYFSHTCDRHPRDVGHKFLAKETYKYLQDNNYLNQ